MSNIVFIKGMKVKMTDMGIRQGLNKTRQSRWSHKGMKPKLGTIMSNGVTGKNNLISVRQVGHLSIKRWHVDFWEPI